MRGFYVKLRVDNAEGYAEEELKVEVKELTPPVISLALPSQGLKVVRNTDYTFTPDIQHSDVEGFKSNGYGKENRFHREYLYFQ